MRPRRTSTAPATTGSVRRPTPPGGTSTRSPQTRPRRRVAWSRRRWPRVTAPSRSPGPAPMSLALIDIAERDGFTVADDGSVAVGRALPAAGPLLVLLAGGEQPVAAEMLETRAAQLDSQINAALDRLGAADDDAASDIAAAWRSDPPRSPAPTVPAGAWPVGAVDVVDAWPAMSQDRIAAQIAAMTPAQRDRLITEFPRQVGNTDGVPWDMRIAANRLNIAAAVLAEDGRDAGSHRRTVFYRSLLGEIEAPTGSPARVRAADPGIRPGPRVAGGTQRRPRRRPQRRGAGARREHHDRRFGRQHRHRSAVRVGQPRRGRRDHLSGRSVSPGARSCGGAPRRRGSRVRAADGAATGRVQRGRRTHGRPPVCRSR